MRKDTRTLVIGLAVFAVAAASPFVLGRGDLPWAPAKQETLSIRASCRSGNAVVGVWVAEDTNAGLFATRDPQAERPPAAAYSARIPAGVAYALHIGCGGTAGRWQVSANSGTTTAISLTVRCQDIAGVPAYKTCS